MKKTLCFLGIMTVFLLSGCGDAPSSGTIAAASDTTRTVTVTPAEVTVLEAPMP